MGWRFTLAGRMALGWAERVRVALGWGLGGAGFGWRSAGGWAERGSAGVAQTARPFAGMARWCGLGWVEPGWAGLTAERVGQG
ncbi:MAG TPA: hypothetical protein VF163_06295 [Micromonosporaceae bacterium]